MSGVDEKKREHDPDPIWVSKSELILHQNTRRIYFFQIRTVSEKVSGAEDAQDETEDSSLWWLCRKGREEAELLHRQGCW